MHQRFAVTISLLIMLVGCGQPSEEAATAAPATSGTAMHGAAAASGAPVVDRDVSGVDGCKLITSPEIVALAGAAKLAAPPTSFPAGCLYVVEMPGGAGESYQFAYQAASLERMLIEHTEPDEHMEKVSGPWDSAMMGPQPLGKGIRLIAVTGGVGIEVSGDRPEPIMALAKLAAERAP